MSITALLFAAALASSPVVTGADADSNRCIGSAGYTWSPLREDCIRVFADGIRLDPVTPEGSAVISAFIVFKREPRVGPLELHVPGEKAPLRLKRKGNVWTGHGWTVRQKKGAWEASRNGKVVYRGEPA